LIILVLKIKNVRFRTFCWQSAHCVERNNWVCCIFEKTGFMRQIFYALLMTVMAMGGIVGCVEKKAPIDENARPMSYSETYLESFLDSVGRLPIEPMVRKAEKYSDSIFYDLKNFSVEWSMSDIEALKKNAKKGVMSEDLAKKYQLKYDPKEVKESWVFIESFFFDESKSEFAISIGSLAGWGGEVYFFQKNKCIAYQHIEHRYGLELEHYTDAEGKTVVYYRENFESGTGIWWFDFYFYRYDDGELKPILSELQNGNLSMMPAYHARWLESTVVNTNPLTLKMVYYLSGENEEYIINDSTEVSYKWDAINKVLHGDYQHSKLSKEQILSYNLGSPNDLFFVRAHYDLFKQLLKDEAKRKLVFYYLNDVKAGLGNE